MPAGDFGNRRTWAAEDICAKEISYAEEVTGDQPYGLALTDSQTAGTCRPLPWMLLPILGKPVSFARI